MDGPSTLVGSCLFQRPADREVLASVPEPPPTNRERVGPTPLVPYRMTLLPWRQRFPVPPGTRVRFYGRQGAPLDIEVPPPAESE